MSRKSALTERNGGYYIDSALYILFAEWVIALRVRADIMVNGVEAVAFQ